MIPEHYGIVERNIYRCATIQQNTFTVFKGIKTVLLLSPESPTKVLLNWITDNNIQMIHLGLNHLSKAAMSSWRPIPEELIKEGLEVLLNADMHPCLIMCT
jgi:protein tyrosine/serine phosphatase